jgi:uncharacterized protein (TIGR00288 family)
MSLPRAILFVDGENLTFRFQDMVASGLKPNSHVVHAPDVFVWHNKLMKNHEFDLWKVVRVCYYTSVAGDDLKIVDVKNQLSQIRFLSRGDDGATEAQIVPIVFKKLAKSQKTRNVDIQIVIDIMRFAFTDEIDRVYLASGDGDYLPLISEVMRRGKQVELLAFSSGLSDALRYSVDSFYSLDKLFFGPENEV